jgi:hypothetical protein
MWKASAPTLRRQGEEREQEDLVGGAKSVENKRVMPALGSQRISNFILLHLNCDGKFNKGKGGSKI